MSRKDRDVQYPNRYSTQNSSLEATARRICESRGGKWSGTKGMACCPAHDDRTPSLGVTLGQKAILFHCFAGCDQQSVLAALAREGFEAPALFSGSETTNEPVPASTRKPSAAALRIWRDTQPLRASPAKAYLESRGILAASPALRFHPRTPLGPKESDLFPPGEQLSSVPLAYAVGARIAELLASRRHLTRADISGLFAEETGVMDWGSAWTIDDYNSAVEIGALLWLREASRIDLATNVHEAEARFDWLEAALPPRHVRSEAQVELQQFSTPPMLAWLMAKAAAVGAHDTLLEPSAGNGALALWGSVQNASLVLNEIDPARRDSLGHIFPSATITAQDGELIADLHRGPVASSLPS